MVNNADCRRVVLNTGSREYWTIKGQFLAAWQFSEILEVGQLRRGNGRASSMASAMPSLRVAA